jgi:ring-1,2-phenylacetyl-CoA epoxidase subunit PaaC
VTVSLAPRRASIAVSNPKLQDLDPGTRAAYGGLLVAMADSELVIGHRHSEWTGFAPAAEEDVAFSSIAQDEMGHAHLYYALVAGAADGGAVDSLALDRGPRSMRHLPLLHAPNGDWFFTIARHIYWEVWEDVLLNAALASSLPLLGGAAERVLNEELYHEEHAMQWLRLLSSKPKQRRRLQAALARVVDLGGNPATRLDGLAELGAAGLLAHRQDLASGFKAAIRRRLMDVGGWPASEAATAVAGLDSQGPWTSPRGLLQLHRDLTGMRRAHPGASW